MDRAPHRLLLCLTFAAASQAQTPQALFETHCANCHSPSNTIGAPLPQTLHQMSWKAILEALETGRMKGIGDTLNPAQREAIAKFAGTTDTQPVLPVARCAAPPRKVSGSDWNGWSDPASTRFQSARAAGLTLQSTPKLKLKWSFGFPGVTTSFGTPTIFEGRLLVGDANGVVYSLDARSGLHLLELHRFRWSTRCANRWRQVSLLRRSSRERLRARPRHWGSDLEDTRRRSPSCRNHGLTEALPGPPFCSRVRTR